MNNTTQVHFKIQIQGVTDKTLVVRGFEGEEVLGEAPQSLAMCQHSAANGLGFHYQVRLANRTEAEPLDISQWIDCEATLTIEAAGQKPKYVHGVISNAHFSGEGKRYRFYQLTIVPALARLALRHNTRIFQNKTTKQIIETLLDEMGISQRSFTFGRTTDATIQREFCVQYRESDLAFLQRLAAEEGWTFHFNHQAKHHKLVFVDRPALLPKHAKAVQYMPNTGGIAAFASVMELTQHYHQQTGKVTLKDYSFKKPQYALSFSQDNKQTLNATHKQWVPHYEHYDVPGRFKRDHTGKPFTQSRLDHLSKETQLLVGKSNLTHLLAGEGMVFDKKQVSLFKGLVADNQVLVFVRHIGEQSQALEEEGGEGKTTYENVFVTAPRQFHWPLTPQPKPLVDGPMVATVVGPKGEEIFCDEFGRVRVQFHWDRRKVGDTKKGVAKVEDHSCWLRVSQGWAGNQYGMLAIPRIGHEVIVSFLNGDPDQPIITGCTYHAKNLVPNPLPNHKTRTVIRTKSHLSQGFNELRFEDETDHEQIYLHAQKDLDMEVKQHRHTSVGGDSHRQVMGDYLFTLKKNLHRLVQGSLFHRVDKDQHQSTGGNWLQEIIGSVQRYIGGGEIVQINGAQVTDITGAVEQQVGASMRVSVQKDSYHKAKEIVLDAGDSLTIKSKGGFIKIDSQGITISGNKVKVNEGGSPGKGTAAKVEKPQKPTQPTPASPVEHRK